MTTTIEILSHLARFIRGRLASIIAACLARLILAYLTRLTEHAILLIKELLREFTEGPDI